jgi:hypothetical protein
MALSEGFSKKPFTVAQVENCSGHGDNAPIGRIRSPCCARAASGHAKPRDELSPSHP